LKFQTSAVHAEPSAGRAAAPEPELDHFQCLACTGKNSYNLVARRWPRWTFAAWRLLLDGNRMALLRRTLPAERLRETRERSVGDPRLRSARRGRRGTWSLPRCGGQIVARLRHANLALVRRNDAIYIFLLGVQLGGPAVNATLRSHRRRSNTFAEFGCCIRVIFITNIQSKMIHPSPGLACCLFIFFGKKIKHKKAPCRRCFTVLVSFFVRKTSPGHDLSPIMWRRPKKNPGQAPLTHPPPEHLVRISVRLTAAGAF
jgi:hypothetical protein